MTLPVGAGKYRSFMKPGATTEQPKIVRSGKPAGQRGIDVGFWLNYDI
jgi:hypothetical protein